MITIHLNGELKQLPDSTSINDLLASVEANGNSLAVVVNEHIIRPEERSTHCLHDGDVVELLMFAGGG
uniref:ThiS, thiamine-biosynthesis n=1 Tax=Chlorobium chlorochromatii (strain CaD3) TaxID=340177 RepID=Q3AR48_CHLCH